ncbi:MAG: methylenetetrahydrofolate reductase (NADPH) [Candidatus Tokpelaia sp. JSC188]|nr:MAG: methylenetetrahydrofolate reductase (NADPH) [Candidatus Tokpelaia sp. JSC188]
MPVCGLLHHGDVGDFINVSFEFFPPRTEQMEKNLWQTVNRLSPLHPHFVSVTYGAGGSTRKYTMRTVARILKETELPVAAHLTCVNATCSEVDQVARSFAALGIRRFVALRGDPINTSGSIYNATPGGYANAVELVAGLKSINSDFDITVSAYPEKHPESLDFAMDIDLLRRKIDNGATRAITQAFFDNDLYERYMDKLYAAGIDIPVLPGILPIHSFRHISNFCNRNGTHIPDWLARRFEGLDNDPKTHALVSAVVAAEQVLDLVERGVKDFHFYTLNHADLSYAVCHLIGIRPKNDRNSSL